MREDLSLALGFKLTLGLVNDLDLRVEVSLLVGVILSGGGVFVFTTKLVLKIFLFSKRSVPIVEESKVGIFFSFTGVILLLVPPIFLFLRLYFGLFFYRFGSLPGVLWLIDLSSNMSSRIFILLEDGVVFWKFFLSSWVRNWRKLPVFYFLERVLFLEEGNKWLFFRRELM